MRHELAETPKSTRYRLFRRVMSNYMTSPDHGPSTTYDLVLASLTNVPTSHSTKADLRVTCHRSSLRQPENLAHWPVSCPTRQVRRLDRTRPTHALRTKVLLGLRPRPDHGGTYHTQGLRRNLPCIMARCARLSQDRVLSLHPCHHHSIGVTV